LLNLLLDMLVPRLPSFFKSRIHKTFSYKPIYYNPKADEREMRKRQIGMAIRKGNSATFNSNNKARRQYNIRLVVIITGLIVLAYYIISF